MREIEGVGGRWEGRGRRDEVERRANDSGSKMYLLLFVGLSYTAFGMTLKNADSSSVTQWHIRSCGKPLSWRM